MLSDKQIQEISNYMPHILRTPRQIFYNKLVYAGLDSSKACSICDMCERFRASENVKNHLAQSIASGCVHQDEFRAMFTECYPMFNKHKERLTTELIHLTRLKPIRIGSFLALLNI